MAKVDSWFPLYIADYRADTARFTTEQHGAYLLIIMDYWRNGPPPDDDRTLAQITGLTLAKWKAHRAVMAPKFQITGGVWRHKRIDLELEKARTVQASLSRKGKAGADARWGIADAPGNASGMPEPIPEPMPGRCTLTTHIPQEPLSTPDGVLVRGKPPDCPHERLIELYHELMPANPRVIEWNETRRGYMRQRWRDKALPNGRTHGYTTVDEGLAYWRRFFEWCSQSDFLTGRTEARPGRQAFIADLEWILKPGNFAKVIEGKYHR